jgi:ABC-type amino acid transport system permease subunit
MRSSSTRALKAIALVYIEAVRSIPFVILLPARPYRRPDRGSQVRK